MATMAMLHTPARPLVTMGRAISITASSWAWVHGRTGAMLTAGVAIASSVVAEAGMPADLDAPLSGRVSDLLPGQVSDLVPGQVSDLVPGQVSGLLPDLLP